MGALVAAGVSMQNALYLTHKANRFAEIDDVSDQIFEEITPQEPPEQSHEIDRSRVRTRLLDFAYYVRGVAKEDDAKLEVDDHDTRGNGATETDQASQCDEGQLTFGWLAIVDGPGRGQSFAFSKEVTRIGRGVDQDVCLDFGDDYISRSAHVTIHFEQDRGLVAVRCGQKRNPVLLNGKLLSATRLLRHNSRITVGQTTLRFVGIDDQDAFWTA